MTITSTLPSVPKATAPAPLPGAAAPTVPPKTPGIQLGMPGWSLDAPQGVIYAGGTPVKLVPAIVSTLALKLIFFTGGKASAKAKALFSRKKAGEPIPALATNPRRRKRRRSRRR